MNNFLAELRRRNIFRVAAAYLVVGWLVMQVVATISAAAGMPVWTDSLALILLVTGFPIVLFIAWAFELTPEGLNKTEEASEPAASKPLGTSDYVLISSVLVVVAVAGLQTLTPQGDVDTAANGTPTIEDTSAIVLSEPLPVSVASIAVLPFADLSPTGDQEYFSDGTSEEILNVLVRVEGLRVASRTSAFAYKGSPLRIPDIADELGVRHILEGSVRRSGDTIRITAQLIDAQTDEHLWSQTYDRTLTTENVFAIQDEISQAIVVELSSRIAGLSPAALPTATADTADIAILDLYYEADALFIARGVDNLVRATALFEEITERDPGFARGWAGLAMAYTVSSSWGLPPRDYDNLTRMAAARAIEINPDLSSAYAVLGINEVSGNNGNPRVALDNYETALRLDPNNANIYNWRALLWRSSGFSARALEDLETCLRLDPAYINCRYNQFFQFSALGQHDEAEVINHQLLLDGATEQLEGFFYLQHLADTGDRDALLLTLNLIVEKQFPEQSWLVEQLYLAFSDPDYDRAAGYEQISQRLETLQELKISLSATIAQVFQDYDSPSLTFYLIPETYFRMPGMSRAQSRSLIEAGRLPEFWRAYEYPPGCRPIPAEDDGDIEDYDCDWMPDL